MKTSYILLMTATAIVSSLAEPMFGNNSAVPKNSTTANSTAIIINNKARTGISCGPGNGVWVLGGQFYSLVDQFCLTVEGSDISDGYSQSDTYLTELSPQGKAQQGDAGKVIFAIKNNGQTPAYHINDWMDDCATPLKALIDQDCAGERGDTKGGTNTIGKIVFEATVKKGDTW
ncbi:hypothetical protein KCU93_g8752, partial [Aureobasidium melanogenum]